MSEGWGHKTDQATGQRTSPPASDAAWQVSEIRTLLPIGQWCHHTNGEPLVAQLL